MQRVMSWGLLLVGVTLAILAVPPEVEALSIAWESDSYVETRAEVLHHYTQNHPRGPSTQVVKFDYTVDGTEYHGDNHLTQFDDSREEIEAKIHKEGDQKTMTVYYDPDYPETVLIHRDVGLLVPLGILAATGFCLYGGVSGLIEERRSQERRGRRGGVLGD